MDRGHILILFGSGNGEDLPSEMTKNHVKEFLLSKQYKFTELRFNKNTILEDLARIKPDVVFNAMHGGFGEDGRIPGLLDIMQIPYTHDNHYVSSVGFNKYYTKAMMEFSGIPVPNGILVTREEILSGKFLRHEITKSDYIIKPNCSGSTLGLCIRVGDSLSLPILESDLIDQDEFLLEEFIPGKEVAALVFNKNIVGAVELISKNQSDHHIITYDDKYIDICDRNAPDLNSFILDKIHHYVMRLVHVLDLKCIGRLDFRINGDKIYALEVNTHPGLGKKSMFANICQQYDVSMFSIFEHLILNAKYNAN